MSDLLAMLVARAGIARAELTAERDRRGEPVRVLDNAEFRRIAALPRREPADYTEALSDALRTPAGTMRLRPIQAQALCELVTARGLFAPITVGGGKTVISYLAPAVLDAKRPLLLVPAKLREKTRRDFAKLALHWRGPNPRAYRIESFELLGRVSAGAQTDGTPGFLERYAPDLIVCDEVHRARNTRAAVTRRIARYVTAAQVPVVAMSGTITKRSLKDYAHILAWCLRDGAPVPLTWHDLEAWADALDEHTGARRDAGAAGRRAPGALKLFADGAEDLASVRAGYQRRLTDTPGVVASNGASGYAGSLLLTALRPEKEDPLIEAHLSRLRDEWLTPDDHPLTEPLAVWRHAREIALGFYYRWDPPAPKAWLEPRREWSSVCRGVLTTNRRDIDSESQLVRLLLADPKAYPEAHAAYLRWRDVRDSFVPVTECVWFSTEALDGVRDALHANAPTIVWCEHVAFARELSRRTGLAYYGRQGRTDDGRFIDDHDPRMSMIASVASNAEGRNLHAWSRSLVVSMSPSGAQAEQLLGRTHRDGQTADSVECAIWLGSVDSLRALAQARRDAEYQAALTGAPQKLLLADVDVPDEIGLGGGARWS